MIYSNETFGRKFTDYVVKKGFISGPFFIKFISFLKKYPKLYIIYNEFLSSIEEKYEYEIFKQLIKKNMTVMDIGANIGMYTILAAKLLDGTGEIYAFEPELYNYRCLKGRIKNAGIANVKTERLALSDKNGSITLYLDTIPTCHSFSKKNLNSGSKYQIVKTTTLDEYLLLEKIKSVDIIVIDVQGAEAKVFNGAKNLLKNGITTIMMEFWPQGMVNMGDNPFRLIKDLAGYGYKFKVIDKVKKRLTIISPTNLCKEAKKWLSTPNYTNLLITKKD